MRYKNVIYFPYINEIGGVEQMMYNLCLKYASDFDITIMYKGGHPKQLERLRKLVRCVEWHEDEIECDVLITNYQIEIIDYTKANKYYQIIHADYYVEREKLKPHLDDRFDKYICVSKSVKESYKRVTGLSEEKLTVCYNPLVIVNTKKALLLLSMTRLTYEKGLNRMFSLARALDSRGIAYKWFIFTDVKRKEILEYPNLILLKSDLNNYPYMAMADYYVALSDCEGWSYSVNEFASIKGKDKFITTPIPSFTEMGVGGIKLDFDLSNMEAAVGEIEKRIEIIDVNIDIGGDYGQYLVRSKSKYRMEEYKVIANKKFEDILDSTIGRTRLENEEFLVDEDRLQVLIKNDLVKAYELVKEEPKTEIKTEAKPKAKTTRKSNGSKSKSIKKPTR